LFLKVATLDDLLWATVHQIALMLKVRVVVLYPRTAVLLSRPGFHLRICSTKMKTPVELVLPLLSKAPRAHDQTPLQIAAGDQLFNEQARHDGLARPWVVSQQNRNGWRGSIDS
jgi:hypothetical protein